MRILIADDDATCRKVVASAFKQYAEIVEVADGEEALDQVTEAIESGKNFSFVVLDIAMPKIDGLDVLAAIRVLEEDKGVPSGQGMKSIIITGNSDMGNIYDAHALECNAYLVKPIDVKKLITEAKRMGLPLNG